MSARCVSPAQVPSSGKGGALGTEALLVTGT